MVMPCDRGNQDSDRGNGVCKIEITNVKLLSQDKRNL